MPTIGSAVKFHSRDGIFDALVFGYDENNTLILLRVDTTSPGVEAIARWERLVGHKEDDYGRHWEEIKEWQTVTITTHKE